MFGFNFHSFGILYIQGGGGFQKYSDSIASRVASSASLGYSGSRIDLGLYGIISEEIKIDTDIGTFKTKYALFGMESRFKISFASLGLKVGSTTCNINWTHPSMPNAYTWEFNGFHLGPSAGIKISILPFVSIFLEGSYLFTPAMKDKGIEHTDFYLLNALGYLRFDF